MVEIDGVGQGAGPDARPRMSISQRHSAKLSLVEADLCWLTRTSRVAGNDFLQQHGVAALPDIKIFRSGKRSDYFAAADDADLVDIARWNAARTMHRRA